MSLDQKRDYFNGLAAQWDQLPVPPDAPEKLARFVRLSVPADLTAILDAGCGTGLLLAPLMRSAPACRIVELDIAAHMLTRSRAKFPGERITHVCADARQLPFGPSTFDLVLCFNALPHMTPIETALGGLLGCLRPGGRLAVGHLMASEELNAFHASIGGVVAGDRLPSASYLAAVLSGLGAEVIRQEEEAGWYAVEARRRA